MGWQHLLLEALPLLAQRQQERRWQLQAALVAAVAAGSGGTDLARQLLQCLASRVQRQLEHYQASSSGGGGGSDSGEASGSALRQALLADMQSLQQLLLECHAAAVPTPAAAAALHQLQGAADACMGALMQAMQQPRADEQEQQRQERQAVFQQLCQLRARLMLSFAAAAATASTGSSDSEACAMQPVAAPLLLLNVDSSGGSGSSATTAAQVWRTVLQMPADVPAAAAAAAAATAAGGGGMPQPSRQQFLAACVAVECYRQAATGVSNSNDSAAAAEHTGNSFGFQTEIAALPGVLFELPPLSLLALGPHSAAAKPTGASAAMAAAAEAAAAEVAQDPGCLGPAQLALMAFQLAEQLAEVGSATEPAGTAGAGTSARQLLLELAAAAAASATEPAQQRQLLLLLLHGQRAWQQRLWRALAADQQLQQRCRRELVAVANRLASGDQSCLPLCLPACLPTIFMLPSAVAAAVAAAVVLLSCKVSMRQ
jgi:hypothetical protein